MKGARFYAKNGFGMTDIISLQTVRERFYLFGSRPVTHITFWLGYYVLFSLIWMSPERGYFASFYLEFVLLPPRAMAVYGMIYFLMPRYLLAERYGAFFGGYGALLLLAAFLQRLSGYYFYDYLLLGTTQPFFDIGALARSVILVNTTVIAVGAVKMYQFYLLEAYSNREKAPTAAPITLKANRRTHILQPDDILFVEGMGNYVTYFLSGGEKLVVYSSMKAADEILPDQFLRLQRSYIVNRRHISAFNAEKVFVGDHELPRGKDITDDTLAVAVAD